MKARTRRFAMLSAVLLLTSVSSLVRGRQEKPAADRQTEVETFDLWGMPVGLDRVTLGEEEDGRYALRGRAVNRADELLRGVRLLVLVMDGEGRVRRHIALSEALKVEGGASAGFAYLLPEKFRVRKPERVVLATEEATGAGSLWRVAGTAELTAYLTGERAQMPEVRRIGNLDDRMPHADLMQRRP